VYGDGCQIRDWVHVLDHADAIWMVLTKGKVGEVYNIGGQAETTNITIVREILKQLRKPDSLIKHVTDRLGHDRRYAIDITKIKTELGWTPQRNLETGLAETVEWYLSNRTWWERIQSEAYRAANALYLNA
jgi:dTDP-glucose 4,6-dehydratase